MPLSFFAFWYPDSPFLKPTRVVEELVEAPQSPRGYFSGLRWQGVTILQGTKDSPFQDVVVLFLGMP